MMPSQRNTDVYKRQVSLLESSFKCHGTAVALHFHPVQETHAEQRHRHFALVDQRIDVVQGHIADPYRIQLNFADHGLAVRRLGHALLAAVEIEPDPAGIGGAQRNHGRPGIDDEAHRGAVDRPRGVEMPLAIGVQDDFSGTVGGSGADGVLADTQWTLLAAEL